MHDYRWVFSIHSVFVLGPPADTKFCIETNLKFSPLLPPKEIPRKSFLRETRCFSPFWAILKSGEAARDCLKHGEGSGGAGLAQCASGRPLLNQM